MKQVVQSYSTGELKVEEVPVPALLPNSLLVRNHFSAISSGTETLMMELASKSLLGKALARPDLVKRVIQKVKLEGLREAYLQSRARLEQPVPLGYSSAGQVKEIGEVVKGFQSGERVACAGSGYASHAEVVSVPAHLCVHVPPGVRMEHAAFACLGAISIHSLKKASLKSGEAVVILGLGLLGQLACQAACAWGLRVFAIDIIPSRVEKALTKGAEDGGIAGRDDIRALVREFTGGQGARAVVIFASSPSQEPLELAAEICGDGGKIVAPGMIGLNIPRRPFYEKELTLIVPRFAGSLDSKNIRLSPSNNDTVAGNMSEFLTLVSEGKVKLEDLITHRFDIREAEKAYGLLKRKEREQSLGILLSYVQGSPEQDKAIEISHTEKLADIQVGFIGAGLFARGTLLPIVSKAPGISLRGLCTATSSSSSFSAKKWGFAYATADYKKVFQDSSISCVFIATRHNQHAGMVEEALLAGKKVFVEKPLALNTEELSRVMAAQGKSAGFLMVGFNRRFAPLSIKAKELLGPSGQPLIINCRVNAGFVPADSWTQDLLQGGGRIIGEVCHFIDLIQFFTCSLPQSVYAQDISAADKNSHQKENLIINMKMRNGDVAAVLYTSTGDMAFPRERIEIFGRGSVAIIDDFKKMIFSREGKARHFRYFSVDRGHKNEIKAFFEAVRKGLPAPVNFEEYVYTTLATFKIVEALKKDSPQIVDASALVS